MPQGYDAGFNSGCFGQRSKRGKDVSLDGLTPKQEAFVSSYLETGNATEAYRRSYDAKNMSEATINVKACELLKNGKVAVRLQVLQERAASKVVLTRAWVLERLMRNADKALELEDLTASNKALELLGKVDELSLFVERTSATTDNRHTVSTEPVSAFHEFLAGSAGEPSEKPSKGSVPN